MVEAQEGTVDVDDGLDNTTQSYTIHVDKEKAAEYGMTTAQVLNSVILREKGGSSMMNWNWRDLDDVDDLIFTDAGWKHSER